MIISLTGFMGCGKSSVGKRLSTLLSCRFIDLDDYIESVACMKIPEIFEVLGEAGFREKEYEALSGIISDFGSDDDNITVLSLGGGTLTTEKCRKIIKSKTKCFYLKAETETLERNLEKNWENRPLISKTCGSGQNLRQIIYSLMEERSLFYEECASATVDTDGKTFDEITYRIYKLTIENL